MDCDICNHAEHEPGKCEQCNCGEGGISHGGAISTDKTKTIFLQDFRRGEVSTETVAHIKPRKTGND